MATEIVTQDIVEWAKTYKGPLFHSLMCDPPYSLKFMGKAWDTDIVFKPETWIALKEHLHPGAFCMAFASSRGWHRMAVAIEDAGFIFHPSIGMLHGWNFGSGFPKASRIKGEAAETFSGHRYGLQAMKPAFEPIVVFQKPYEGKPTDSIMATGAGSINVDGGRIGTAEVIENHSRSEEASASKGIYGASKEQETHQTVGQKLGRWPANLTLVHLPECRRDGVKKVAGSLIEKPCPDPEITGHKWGSMQGNRGARGHGDPDGTETVDAWICAPGCPVEAFDGQAGPLESGSDNVRGKDGQFGAGDIQHPMGHAGDPQVSYGDQGGASRFFMQAGWEAETFERLSAANPVFYEPKASRDERDAGLSAAVAQERRLQSSAGLKCSKCGKWKASGSPCVCPEPDFVKSDFVSPTNFNPHPTVKPIALSTWLATLLLPPDKYAPRRLLIPFAGVGSECIGAEMAGWDEVVGVEREAEYADIARQRIEFWISTIQLKLF